MPLDFEDDRTIYERMACVLSDLPAIGKTQRNEQQKFNFRGIDDVLNALNPLLAKHGVFYLPDVLARASEERATRSGGVLYVTHLHVRYRFYGLKGDHIDASGWGEGTDSGDKATPKAMTGAMKAVLFQAFAISTEETAQSDGDAHTPEETVSGGQQVSDRIGALSEAEKGRLREEWKAAGLPAPRRLRGGQVAEALRLVDGVAGFEERSEGAAVPASGDAGPPPTAEGKSNGATPTIGANERKRIMALCTERGISTAEEDRAERLNQLGQMVGRVPLKSVNDIRLGDEYERLITALKELPKTQSQPELAR